MPPSNPPPTNPFRMLVTRNRPPRSSKIARRSLGDVVEDVAAEQHGDVVLLEQRRFRVARKPDRIFEHADRSLPRLRRTAVEREMAIRLGGHEPLEVGEPPGHRHAETGRRGLEPLVEPANAFSSSARASASSPGDSPTRSVAVTTWWWSGGTSTSMPLSSATRIPSRSAARERRARPRRAQAVQSARRRACRCRSLRAQTLRRPRR